ncbi:MerR family transcriptional regulator [Enterococcus sp. UD-01]|jgi:DNA-binding transcriptional MerR regulator|uniref:MerR family transcriptional regulator n=1 Tax=Enterococcus sp. UD-01 TaxID=3373911 RepID=UPI0038367AA9
MNISKASEETQVSADTIRYYERIGLIPPVQRNENGVRNFTEEDLNWITFSRHMRSAGLSIESLIDYLTLFREGDQTIPARMELLKEQKKLLEDKIAAMQGVLERLDYKIENYDNHMVPKEKQLKNFD